MVFIHSLIEITLIEILEILEIIKTIYDVLFMALVG